MKRVRVLFFGPTAAITGTRQIEIELADELRSADVFQDLKAKYPELSSHRLLFSLNQQYATGDEMVRDGDELAIFTAVSGG